MTLSDAKIAAITTFIDFYVGTLIIHTMTAYTKTPETMLNATKRFLGMAVSPVTAGLSSCRSLLLFVWHLHAQRPGEHRSSAHHAVSAGAMAVQILLTLRNFVKENLGWSELGNVVRDHLMGHDHPGSNSHSVAVDPQTHRVFFPLMSGPNGTPVLRIMRPAGT